MFNKPVSNVSASVDNTFVTWRKQRGWSPLKIVSAKGCYFTDSNGNNYLDFSSQLMCSNLGHGNEKIIEAIKKQAESLPFIAPSFDTDIRENVTKKLLTVLPPNLKKFFYGTSGTEANEAAVKISRMVKAKEGNTKVFSFYNSYHGSTLGSLQLTGDFRRVMVDGYHDAPGFHHLPPPYCYRCPFGLTYPECGVACAEYVDYAIKKEGDVAALVLEPVTGTNGVVVPPKEFLPRVREITEENDVIMIDDEVMTGFGRTGEWFAVNHSGVEPDILCAAKGLTGAYAPLSLTAVSGEISDYFEDNYFAHGHTYEAHPLVMSAASAAIDEYKDRNIIEHVKMISPLFIQRLHELKETHISVGDTRGIGLFGAVEIVKNRDTKKPFNNYEDKVSGKPLMVDTVAKTAMENGVFISTWVSHFVIAPPLIINEEELNKGFDVLDKSLELADKEARK